MLSPIPHGHILGVLRGLIQGAIESPEFCKCLVNTIAEWVGLKIVGFSLFHPDGSPAQISQLIFADDAAGFCGEFSMLQRLARFWSLWAWIMGMKVNIAGFKKTVWSGLTFKKGSDGFWSPADAFDGKGILKIGDRTVPQLSCFLTYVYCGLHTSLAGAHKAPQKKALLAKCEAHSGRCRSVLSVRREAVDIQNSQTFGNGGFYGAVYGGTLEELENTFGPITRRVLHSGGLGKGRRAKNSPRLFAHAPVSRRTRAPENDKGRGALWEATKAVQVISGLGLAHFGPCMLAANANAFCNCFAMPVKAPGRDVVHAAYAQLLVELGCFDDPAQAVLGELHVLLDHDDPIERAVANLNLARGGRMDFRRHELPGDEDGPLQAHFWPGWPEDAILLWQGAILSEWASSKSAASETQGFSCAGASSSWRLSANSTVDLQRHSKKTGKLLGESSPTSTALDMPNKLTPDS